MVMTAPTKASLFTLARSAHHGRGGAVLDHREVPRDGSFADIERVCFTGFSVGGGVRFEIRIIKFGMVGHQGGIALEVGCSSGHLSG